MPRKKAVCYEFQCASCHKPATTAGLTITETCQLIFVLSCGTAGCPETRAVQIDPFLEATKVREGFVPTSEVDDDIASSLQELPDLARWIPLEVPCSSCGTVEVTAAVRLSPDGEEIYLQAVCRVCKKAISGTAGIRDLVASAKKEASQAASNIDLATIDAGNYLM